MSAVRPLWKNVEHPASVDEAVAEAKLAHELRQDQCDDIPLRRRGRRIKKRPRTAIISDALCGDGRCRK